jgi:hypothetical protein
MTTIGLYTIGTSTTLESNKSLRQNHLRTRSWRGTRYAAQGRAARVRS